MPGTRRISWGLALSGLVWACVVMGPASPAQAGPFDQPRAGLSVSDQLDFAIGRALFDKLWVSAPASTKASDGLGPLFNARACRSCHIGNGRGHPPEGPDDRRPGFVMRLFHPDGGGDPTYGRQVQDRAVGGLRSEGHARVTYLDQVVMLNGGQVATLRKPVFALADPGHGPLDPLTRASGRAAQQLIGLGLLARIPDAALAAAADPDDSDGDGVSGRVHWVQDAGGVRAGRFGYKAAHPSLRSQVVQAFFDDMGLSTPDLSAGYGACTSAQGACRAAPDGNSAIHGGVEVGEDALAATVFYTANLSVPPRRAVTDAAVIAGEAAFHAAGCASCHTPAQVTADGTVFHPYTDLLLHDLGPDLADPFSTGGAGAAEWRTAPLWGIGLTKTVTGRQSYLHDGRARTLLEAILWHAGEAAPARDHVIDMTPTERDALITFLESL